jgi:hypothetical protein
LSYSGLEHGLSFGSKLLNNFHVYATSHSRFKLHLSFRLLQSYFGIIFIKKIVIFPSSWPTRFSLINTRHINMHACMQCTHKQTNKQMKSLLKSLWGNSFHKQLKKTVSMQIRTLTQLISKMINDGEINATVIQE